MISRMTVPLLIALIMGLNLATTSPLAEPVTEKAPKYLKEVTEEPPEEPIEDAVEEVVVDVVVPEAPTPEPTLVYLGKFKASAYCKENYPHICNNGDSSTTATGTVPTVGRTIAVDPSVISYGTQVVIDGHTYIAEDCGGGVKGNRVDILFATHREALNFGIQYVDVFVVKENG